MRDAMIKNAREQLRRLSSASGICCCRKVAQQLCVLLVILHGRTAFDVAGNALAFETILFWAIWFQSSP